MTGGSVTLPKRLGFGTRRLWLLGLAEQPTPCPAATDHKSRILRSVLVAPWRRVSYDYAGRERGVHHPMAPRLVARRLAACTLTDSLAQATDVPAFPPKVGHSR